jgi:hypothetical protein
MKRPLDLLKCTCERLLDEEDEEEFEKSEEEDLADGTFGVELEPLRSSKDARLLSPRATQSGLLCVLIGLFANSGVHAMPACLACLAWFTTTTSVVVGKSNSHVPRSACDSDDDVVAYFKSSVRYSEGFREHVCDLDWDGLSL